MYTIYADDELLYAPNLINEGYGVLSPKLTMELNKAGSLEFVVPPNNVMYGSLSKLKTTIRVKDDQEEIWRGRILHDEKDFYNRKTVYCEGALSFLTDTIQRPYSFTGAVSSLFAKYMTEHANQASENRLISRGSCNVTDPNDYIVRSNSDYVSSWDEMSSKLLGILGGYFKLTYGAGDKLTLSYVTDYDSISDQVIEFGVNLLDISEYVNAEDVFTVLIPLGAKTENEDGSEGPRLTISSLYADGHDYVENATAINLFGRIVRTQVWDDVTVARNLLTKGQEYLSAGIDMAVTLNIKAVDLHVIDVDTKRIKLGDFVRVVSAPHELDKYFLCSKIILDLQSPEKTEFTLGVSYSAMTDRQVANQKKSQDAYTIAENANTTASGASTQVANITGNYVDKVTFMNFQSGVNEKLTAVCHYKGSVSTYSDLPTSGRTVGDTYNVADTGANYTWSGSSWDKLSETVDVPTDYVTNETLEALTARVATIEETGATKEEIPTDYVTTETFASLVERVEALEAGASDSGETEGGE